MSELHGVSLIVLTVETHSGHPPVWDFKVTKEVALTQDQNL